jgi:hypothetical protein
MFVPLEHSLLCALNLLAIWDLFNTRVDEQPAAAERNVRFRWDR